MDIEWVIYHLIHNDDDFESVTLEIDYYDADVWYRLLTSLYRNRVLTKVQLIRAEILTSRNRTIQELQDLFEAIRQIPTLMKIELLGFTQHDLDFGGFTDFLQDHASVQTIQIIVADGTLSRRVLESMASARQLCEALLEISERAEVGILCTCRTLERLRVDTYGEKLQDHHLLTLTEALRATATTNLKVLDMDYTIISSEGVRHVADMLRENVALKELRIGIEMEEEEQDSFLDLIAAMEKNTSLAVFYNYRFRQCENMPPLATQKQLDLLRRNTTLHSLVLFYDDDESSATKEKKLFLALNKGGRGRLFHDIDNATRGDWVDVLANPLTVNSVDCLFYYLTANPSLCKLDGGATFPAGSISPEIDNGAILPPYPASPQGKDSHDVSVAKKLLVAVYDRAGSEHPHVEKKLRVR